jgi:hypothetical protein
MSQQPVSQSRAPAKPARKEGRRRVLQAARRRLLAAAVGLALLAGACGTDAEPTSAPPTTASAVAADDPVERFYAGIPVFNSGDRTAFTELFAAGAEGPGGVAVDDPLFAWVLEVAMDGLHEQIIDAKCHSTGPDVFYCDELHVDDLTRPAGIAWRTSRVYQTADGKILGFEELSSNRATTDEFLAQYIGWIAEEDPEFFAEAFDLEQPIIWVSIDTIRETVARVDEFIAESPDYPLVPPERLANPELTGTVATGSGATIEVYNAGERQLEVVEWGAQRYRSAGLAVPPVASVTFPPQRLCDENSGWAIDTGGEHHIAMCIYEDEMCVDEACTSLTAHARATLVHELAHIWTRHHADDATRERFLELRGLEGWSDRELEWAERGSEQAAEIMMWGLMDDSVDLFRLGRPACEELEAAYQLLTGSPSLRDGC